MLVLLYLLCVVIVVVVDSGIGVGGGGDDTLVTVEQVACYHGMDLVCWCCCC